MHQGLCVILLAAVLLVFGGCSSHVPVWRLKAQETLVQLERDGVDRSHPADYGSVAATVQKGERLLVEEDEEQADELYRLAYQKGVILKIEAALYRARLRDEARQQEILRQAIQAEEERQRREAEELKQQQVRAELKQKSPGGRQLPSSNNDDRHNLPVSHTVRRGETLPQVAARNEIYNDAALWPIIYRANRDQVRDPYQLWPGQVLKIPRGFSREDAIEARKQAARRNH